MTWKISIKDKKDGTRLLTIPSNQGKPTYVSLSQNGIKELAIAMLEETACRGIIFDMVVEERFTPALQEAMIRKLCCEEHQEKLLEELVRVGFNPVIIREELVVGE